MYINIITRLFYYLYSDSALNNQVKSVSLMQENKQMKSYGPSPEFQMGRWYTKREVKEKGQVK